MESLPTVFSEWRPCYATMLKKDYPATWGLRANSGVCFGFLDVALF